MATLFSTAGLARASARHPWRVVAAWLVILVLAAIPARGLSKSLTNDVGFVNYPESRQGLRLLQQSFGVSDVISETVIVHSDTLTVTDQPFQQVVQQTTTALTGLKSVVASAVNYYQAQAASPAQAAVLVSSDQHTTLIPVTLVGDFDQAKQHADEYLQTVRAQGSAEVEVYTVGTISVNQISTKTAEKDLRQAEIVTLIPSIIIMLFVFGALVAAGIPVVLSLVSILTAVGATALLGHLMSISFFVVNMITMIGLAVGIDYTLFIISRYREERRRGLARRDAIRASGATASKAVLFSGITVCLALSGLLILPATLFRSLGLGAVLVVLAALAAMLTLVPALLGLLGDWINWPRRREPAVPVRAGTAAEDRPAGGFWVAVTHVVMGRPIISLTLATLFLVLLAIPFRDLQLGSTGASALPPSDVRQGYTLLNQQFSAGLLSPVEIVVQAGRTPQIEAAINQLSTELQQDPDFVPRPQVQWNSGNDVAELKIPLAMPPDSVKAFDVVARLRHEQIPNAFGDTSARVYVTGSTAINLDFQLLVEHYTPYIFAYVLGLSFLLLLVAFRSIVVPLKAILMNLLSVAAAYGLLVLVFQKGYLIHLFGFQRSPIIESWIPIFLFCVLFGLSMDYHVFLLSRIREHYDLTHDNRESVAEGLSSTARIITGAALIMVVVFAGFAHGKLVMLQQVGFGLAVAILLDATVVRIVIVPSAMALLGDLNWYLPSWLAWVPDLRIENLPQPLLAPATAVAGFPANGKVPAPASRAAGPAEREMVPDPPADPAPPGRVTLVPLAEPELEGGVALSLLDVATMALCAVVSGADSFTEMETFAETRREWLARFVDLASGSPNRDIFSRVFAALDPRQLESTVLPAARERVPAPQRRGRGLPSGSIFGRAQDDGLAAVRVRVSGQHLLLGQSRGAEGALNGLAETLRVVNLDHAVVKIDTPANERAVARQLVEQGADYVIGIDGNQVALKQEIVDAFREAEAGDFTGIAHGFHETLTQGRGRTEHRRFWLIYDPDYLEPLNADAAWPDLNSIGLLEQEELRGESAPQLRYTYFLSSLPDDAHRFAEAVRLQAERSDGWGWLLDVVFSEEFGRVRVGHASENLAVLRRVAFQLLKQERTVRSGLKAKRLKAAWDEQYLLTVLKG